ncbi:hypothetical protein XaCFBP7622_21030, partial [Xanthomonas arboricola]
FVTCGTRRESVRGGSLAASMPPRSRQPAGRRTKSWSVTLKACPLLGFRWADALTPGYPESGRHAPLATMHTDHTDHTDWSLSAYRRGT